MKSTFTKQKIKEIINEELRTFSDGSAAGVMDEALKDLKKASALLQSAAAMMDRADNSRVDGVVNNLMTMNETLYSLIQAIKNSDYEHETSQEKPWAE